MLMIEATDVALPVSLIREEERGGLIITAYIQIGDNFLYREHLELAIMVKSYIMYKKSFMMQNSIFIIAC